MMIWYIYIYDVCTTLQKRRIVYHGIEFLPSSWIRPPSKLTCSPSKRDFVSRIRDNYTVLVWWNRQKGEKLVCAADGRDRRSCDRKIEWNVSEGKWVAIIHPTLRDAGTHFSRLNRLNLAFAPKNTYRSRAWATHFSSSFGGCSVLAGDRDLCCYYVYLTLFCFAADS